MYFAVCACAAGFGHHESTGSAPPSSTSRPAIHNASRQPPYPSCGAPAEDQLASPMAPTEPSGIACAATAAGHPTPGWDDPLVPISADEWRTQSRVMSARAHARWRAADAERYGVGPEGQ